LLKTNQPVDLLVKSVESTEKDVESFYSFYKNKSFSLYQNYRHFEYEDVFKNISRAIPGIDYVGLNELVHFGLNQTFQVCILCIACYFKIIF
jgi:hypothetical protein